MPINIFDQAFPADYQPIDTNVPVPFEALAKLGAQKQGLADMTRAKADELENILQGLKYATWDSDAAQSFQQEVVNKPIEDFMNKHRSLSTPEAQRDFYKLERSIKNNPALHAFEMGYNTEQSYNKLLSEKQKEYMIEPNILREKMGYTQHANQGTFRKGVTGQYDWTNPQFYQSKGYTSYADPRAAAEKLINDVAKSGGYKERPDGRGYLITTGGEGNAFNDLLNRAKLGAKSLLEGEAGETIRNQTWARLLSQKGREPSDKEFAEALSKDVDELLQGVAAEKTNWIGKQGLQGDPVWLQQSGFAHEDEKEMMVRWKGQTPSISYQPINANFEASRQQFTQLADTWRQKSEYLKTLDPNSPEYKATDYEVKRAEAQMEQIKNRQLRAAEIARSQGKAPRLDIVGPIYDSMLNKSTQLEMYQIDNTKDKHLSSSLSNLFSSGIDAVYMDANGKEITDSELIKEYRTQLANPGERGAQIQGFTPVPYGSKGTVFAATVTKQEGDKQVQNQVLISIPGLNTEILANSLMDDNAPDANGNFKDQATENNYYKGLGMMYPDLQTDIQDLVTGDTNVPLYSLGENGTQELGNVSKVQAGNESKFIWDKPGVGRYEYGSEDVLMQDLLDYLTEIRYE